MFGIVLNMTYAKEPSGESRASIPPHPSLSGGAGMKALVCVPTYNEAENIADFIGAVFAAAPSSAEMLVIDDSSPDGTAAIAEALVPSYGGRLHILRRAEKQGLGPAYLAAFAWGRSRGYDAFLEMDADFSHNPEYIPAMLREIQTNDVVIGSRNIRGGGVEGWSAARNLISKGGSLYARAVLGCPIKDLTGGFTMWTAAALDAINLTTVIAKGYLFQVEMKYRAYTAGCRVKEIPIIFTDRKRGVSKMSKKIFAEALIGVWKIKKNIARDTGADQFIKFAVTGGLGTITNLLIFFLCADIFHLPEIHVSIGCFIIAATQNYIINHRWSFKQNTVAEHLSAKKWLQFIGASLAGLTINITVMQMILTHFTMPYKFIAQGVGIAAGTIVNFCFSKLVVFRRKHGGKV
jgi:dolichol-phosphate mannosyltransferase